MRIAIDIDDTITNTWKSIIPAACEYFKIDEQLLRNNGKAYNEAIGCTLDEWYTFARKKFDGWKAWGNEIDSDIDMEAYRNGGA